jgi:hypothetical protein
LREEQNIVIYVTAAF